MFAVSGQGAALSASGCMPMSSYNAEVDLVTFILVCSSRRGARVDLRRQSVLSTKAAPASSPFGEARAQERCVKRVAVVRGQYWVMDAAGNPDNMISPDYVAPHLANWNAARINGQRCQELFL